MINIRHQEMHTLELFPKICSDYDTVVKTFFQLQNGVNGLTHIETLWLASSSDQKKKANSTC